jgi:hypothetical protein
MRCVGLLVSGSGCSTLAAGRSGRKVCKCAAAAREKSERATLQAEIRLCIVREKIAALETAEACRQTDRIQTMVKRMVKSGDHTEEFTLTKQFFNSPSQRLSFLHLPASFAAMPSESVKARYY